MKLIKHFILALTLSLLWLVVPSARAWNAQGHMVVSQIAYDNLRPDVKAKCDALIAIPVFNSGNNNSNFVTAACWADDIKSFSSNSIFGNWHYIDLPFSLDGTTTNNCVLPANDVVWAINKCVAALQDPSMSLSNQAVHLRFLLHFVGDIVQPLHCSTAISSSNNCDFGNLGDAGGNGFPLTGGYFNLHSLWDQGATYVNGTITRPFTAGSHTTLTNKVNDVLATYPYAPGFIAPPNPMTWATEGWGLAQSVTYAAISPNTTPSGGYLTTGQATAKQQLARGGQRLADLLNAILAPSAFTNALSLDGTTQHVVVTNFGSIMPTNEVTVEFWAYTTTITDNSVFSLIPDDGLNRFQSHPTWNSGQIFWDFGNITTTGRIYTNYPPNSLTNWIHYAMVASQSGNTMKIYTNGNLCATKVGMDPFERYAADLRIGGGYAFYPGRLDEFRIWNTARSQAQIQANLGAPLTGSETNLLLYYRFDNTSGNVATNSATATGTAFNGTLVNSPTWVASTAPSTVVLNTNDAGAYSLRSTISNAPAGSTITFDPSLSGKTILLTNGHLLLDKNLNIDGSALTNGITLNGNGISRVFGMISGTTNVLTALTLANGYGFNFGGAISNAGWLTVNRCTITGNSAGFGGGIFNEGNLFLNQSTTFGNTALINGAGIYNHYTGTMAMNQSTISGNVAVNSGGGIENVNGTLTTTNSIVCNNSGNSNPNIGGLFSGQNNLVDVNALLAPPGNYGGPTKTMPPLLGSPAVDGCTNGTLFSTDQRGFTRIVGAFADIGAVESGHAIPGYTYGTVVNTTADFQNGSETNLVSLRNAVAFGPTNATITFAPALSGQTIVLTNGQIALNKNLTIDASALANGIVINGNAASRIFNVVSGTTVGLTALTLRDGYAPGGDHPNNSGGGILNQGTLTISYCTVTNNRAIQGSNPGGGGIENNSGILTVQNSTIVGNSSQWGGGIDTFPSGTVSVNNCTLANNNSTSGGGGVYNTGTLMVNSSTLANNSATFGVGGGIRNASPGLLIFTNTIVCSNTAPTAPNITGSISSGANNLVDTNALLAPLGNYGGTTQTMPPLPGSPAIDAGGTTTLITDQRGLTRVVDGNGDTVAAADIGAVELTLNEAVFGLGINPIRWAVGSSNWNATDFTWTDTALNAPTNYTFGINLIFDDLASGTSPILVTNTLAITNGGILFNTSTKAYTLTGMGVISNAVPITKLGTNTLTMAGANPLYAGTFTIGAGRMIWNTGASLGSGTTGSQLVMRNNTSLQIGNGTTFTPPIPIVIAAGANATLSTGNGLSSGPNGSVISGDANAVLNVSGGFSFGGDLQGFTGTVRVNTAFTTRLNKGGAGATDLGSSNAIFIVNGSGPGLRPRNHNTTVHLGALSGTGTLGGSQTTTAANTTTYRIGALNSSTTFGGQFVDNISPSTNVAVVKVGTGTLTLTNHSPHTGATTVSNGMLTLVTSGSLSNSAVTIVSGATNGVILATAGGSTTVSNLTYAAGTEYIVFDFGANAPSPTTAPLLVQNNLAINGTLNISVAGSMISPGTYPLIRYGTFSGTAPTLPLSLPPSVSATISNDSVTSMTLYLVVRSPQVVVNANDSGAGSLRQVMTDSISGDTVIFNNSLSGQTLQLNTQIALTKRLIIDAGSLAGGITIRGKADLGVAGNFRLFHVTGAGNLTLRNLTLAYGGGTALSGNGGAIYAESPVTLTGCTLTRNVSPNNGGAIFNLSATATLSLTHCTFTSNTCAAAYGGAICNDSGSVSVTHSTLTANSAPAVNGEGGGIFNFTGGSTAILTVTNSIIAGNTSTLSGADIRNSGTVTFGGANLVQSLSGSSTGPTPIAAAPQLAPLGNYSGPTQTMPPLPGSPAIDAGGTTTLTTDQRGLPRVVDGNGDTVPVADIGAVELQSVPTSQTVVTTNSDDVNGFDVGGVSLREAVLYATNNATITFAPGLSGQTILLTGGQIVLNKNLTIDGSSLASAVQLNGNNASRIFHVNSGVTVTNNSLVITNGNDTGPSAGGGGILCYGTLTLNNCSLKGNSANQVGWGGGGILNFGGTLTVNQSTLSGNSASQAGGGIWNNSTLTVNQSTISGNSADIGGGILNNGTVNITNSIVCSNTAPAGPNIFGSFSGVNNLLDTNALLAPLGNYGGTTQTMPPLPGSPAIDGCTSGSGFATDQRGLGFPRVMNAYADIGAVEAMVPSIPNASFEADTFTVYPGYANANGGGITGWALSDPGSIGVNNTSFPFANNGVTPAGANVAFIQGSSVNTNTLSATISGLTPGAAYRVSFRANTRNYFPVTPDPTWSVNGGPLTAFTAAPPVNADGVRTQPYYLNSAVFVATGTTAPLVVQNGPVGGFSSLLLDAFTIAPMLAVVTTTADSGQGSLRQAVAEVGSGATITFTNTLSGQTILLTSGQITVNKNLNIDASTLANGIAINGNAAGRVFYVNNGVVAAFKALTIANGLAPAGYSGDSSGGAGGGIFSRGRLDLVNCSVVSNAVAASAGLTALAGGIFCDGGDVRLTNCTVAFNRVTAAGGNGNYAGAFYNFLGTLIFDQCTVASNQANNFNGGVANGGSTLLRATVLANGNTDFFNQNGGASLGNNLITDGTSSSLVNGVNGDQIGTAGSPLNALLAPLGNYGGPTPTMPPLPGSPAIDAGGTTTLITDQRGLPRVVDGNGDTAAVVDIGAVELASTDHLVFAWWRFEAGPNGADVAHSEAVGVFSADVPDSSNNGNDLSIWSTGGGTGYAYRNDVPFVTLPLSGQTNRFSVQNTGGSPAMFTRSNAPFASITPLQWTIEVTMKPENGGYRTFVGRDSFATYSGIPGLAALYLVAQPDNALIIKYADVAGVWHEAGSAPGLIQGFNWPTDPTGALGKWQSAVAVCDGTSLRLYYKNITAGDTAYTLVAQTSLTGSSADLRLSAGTGSGSDWRHGTWSVGRGLYFGGHTDRAYGFIDEVRISGRALTPDQFLGTPPVITLFGANPYTNECHTVFTDPGATNSAVFGVTVTGNVDTNTPGTYMLTYTGTNSYGASASTNRTVVVTDSLAPVITLLGNNPFTNLINAAFVDPGATASDLCNLTASLTTNSTVNVSVPGSYLVTYIANDGNGNSATNTRTVIVPGTYASTPPVLTNVVVMGNGAFQFNFTSDAGALLTVWASTNVALPFNTWSNLGAPVESPAGTFQFTDPQAMNYTERFYRVSSP